MGLEPGRKCYWMIYQRYPSSKPCVHAQTREPHSESRLVSSIERATEIHFENPYWITATTVPVLEFPVIVAQPTSDENWERFHKPN